MKTKSMLHLIRPLALASATLLLGFAPSRARAEEPAPFPAVAPREAEPNSRLPKLLSRVEPAYPAEGRGAAAEQRVFVAFLVDAQGRVKNVSAMFGPPAPFAKAAVAAVEQWTFEPGLVRGKPVTTQMTVAIHFKPANP